VIASPRRFPSFLAVARAVLSQGQPPALDLLELALFDRIGAVFRKFPSLRGTAVELYNRTKLIAEAWDAAGPRMWPVSEPLPLKNLPNSVSHKGDTKAAGFLLQRYDMVETINKARTYNRLMPAAACSFVERVSHSENSRLRAQHQNRS
jgi:hypothetical protein